MRSKNIAEPVGLSKTALVNAYYSWLCDLIDVDQPPQSYWFLTKKLFMRDFYWSVPNDDNRACEGKNLRERFCDENNLIYTYEYFNSECSMLELIIALAFRCESIMVDQYDSIPMREWYWKLLSNVGLNKFTDEVYYDDAAEIVDRILDRIIDRTYHRNGQGGLFPLKRYKKDQRKVELWYQMSEYLIENYYEEDTFV